VILDQPPVRIDREVSSSSHPAQLDVAVEPRDEVQLRKSDQWQPDNAGTTSSAKQTMRETCRNCSAQENDFATF
jgi:hypothetical protein